MDYDQDKIDDAVLALLGFRAFEEDEEGASMEILRSGHHGLPTARAEFWLSAVRALVRAL